MLPLCKELFGILVANPEKSSFTLTFAPDQANIADAYFLVDEDKSIEVVCFKRTYIAIFKECHCYLSRDERKDSHDIINDYYATIGYLLTTTENRSALNLHLDSLLDLVNEASKSDLIFAILRKEITVLGRLLTSSNNKLNKSSSLWCMYRKVYLLLKNLGCDICYSSIFISSASRHFSNYYCWETVRWFFDIVPTELEKKELFLATKAFCFQNTQDSSSWSALGYMVCQKQVKNNFNWNDFKRVQKSLNCRQESSQMHPIHVVDAQELVYKIAERINSFMIEDWPPFLCLLSISRTFKLGHNLSTYVYWEQEVHRFEKKYGLLKFTRKCPLIPEGVPAGTYLARKSRSVGYKKRFLDCLSV